MHEILKYFLIIFILYYPLIVLADNQKEVLDLRVVPEKDFKDIFSDSAVTFTDEKTNKTHINNFYKNGTVTSRRDGKRWKGIWFVDKSGQHCIRWNRKDKSNCAMIMQDDEGKWVKVKDDEIIRRYEKIQDLPTTDSSSKK